MAWNKLKKPILAGRGFLRNFPTPNRPLPVSMPSGRRLCVFPSVHSLSLLQSEGYTVQSPSVPADKRMIGFGQPDWINAGLPPVASANYQTGWNWGMTFGDAGLYWDEVGEGDNYPYLLPEGHLARKGLYQALAYKARTKNYPVYLCSFYDDGYRPNGDDPWRPRYGSQTAARQSIPYFAGGHYLYSDLLVQGYIQAPDYMPNNLYEKLMSIELGVRGVQGLKIQTKQNADGTGEDVDWREPVVGYYDWPTVISPQIGGAFAINAAYARQLTNPAGVLVQQGLRPLSLKIVIGVTLFAWALNAKYVVAWDTLASTTDPNKIDDPQWRPIVSWNPTVSGTPAPTYTPGLVHPSAPESSHDGYAVASNWFRRLCEADGQDASQWAAWRYEGGTQRVVPSDGAVLEEARAGQWGFCRVWNNGKALIFWDPYNVGTKTVVVSLPSGGTVSLSVTDNEPVAYTFGTVSTGPVGNTPPTVANPVPDQTATVGTAFSYTIPSNTFTDGDGSIALVTVSGLPAGLSYNASTRVISGTPAAAGTALVTVTATDNGGASVTDQFQFTVAAAPVGGGGPTFAGVMGYWRLLDTDPGLLNNPATQTKLVQWKDAGGYGVSLGINLSSFYNADRSFTTRYDNIVGWASALGLKILLHLNFAADFNEAQYNDDPFREDPQKDGQIAALKAVGLSYGRLARRSDNGRVASGNACVIPQFHLFAGNPDETSLDGDGLRPWAYYARQFVRDVRTKFAARINDGTVTVISHGISFTQELAHVLATNGNTFLGDYSAAALADYRSWLQGRYGSIAALNSAWGTNLAGFGAVNFPGWNPADREGVFRGNVGRDFYAWRHARLKGAHDQINAWIKAEMPAVRTKCDTGQIEWVESRFFGVMAFKSIAQTFDIVKENWTLWYSDLRFNADFLRSLAAGREVHYELFGAEARDFGVQRATDDTVKVINRGVSGISFFGTGDSEFAANLQVLQNLKTLGYTTSRPSVPAFSGQIGWSLSQALNGQSAFTGRLDAWRAAGGTSHPVAVVLTEDGL